MEDILCSSCEHARVCMFSEYYQKLVNQLNSLDFNKNQFHIKPVCRSYMKSRGTLRENQPTENPLKSVITADITKFMKN